MKGGAELRKEACVCLPVCMNPGGKGTLEVRVGEREKVCVHDSLSSHLSLFGDSLPLPRVAYSPSAPRGPAHSQHTPQAQT